MKSVILKKIEINNFKGIKELSIDFSKVTNIYGENGLGKTSVFDAFSWLLFDKDSKNRSTFDIKPLNEKNQVIRGLKPSVTCLLDINGVELKLSKVLEEKWTKKRGEAEKSFTGNVTTYEINDVPVKQSDYKKKISEIADEEQFKLLTNPYYFSENLNWKEARKVILDIAGDVSIDQVISHNKELELIRGDLESENIEVILKSKKASMKKLADKKKEIPTRINELDRNIVDLDFSDIEKKVKQNKELLTIVEDELLNNGKSNEKVLNYKDKIFDLKNKIRDIEQKALRATNSKKIELSTQLNDLKYKLSSLELNIKVNKNDIDNKEKEKLQLEKEVISLREEFNKKNEEKIDLSDIECECPTCKRPFDEYDINAKKIEMVENYNSHKASVLNEIRERGVNKKKKIEVLVDSINTLKETLVKNEANREPLVKEITEIQSSIDNLETEVNLSIIDKENIEKYKTQIKELEEQIENSNDNNTDDLKNKKAEIEATLSYLNKELAKKDLNKELVDRKDELLKDEKDLGVSIAKLEQVVMLCEEFIKTKVDLLENNINSKFKNVTFKLFKEQVNGGIDEVCEALINGVPFSSANTAGQINAGLDIINTLSKYFNIQVPVFIDNRESINNLIEIDSQVVNLVVTKDKELKIENLQTEGVM